MKEKTLCCICKQQGIYTWDALWGPNRFLGFYRYSRVRIFLFLGHSTERDLLQLMALRCHFASSSNLLISSHLNLIVFIFNSPSLRDLMEFNQSLRNYKF